jgi:hypothetical protein
MKFTQYKKLTSIIALTLISSNAFSAVNIFTPIGGAFSGSQNDTLYWDMTSNNASLTPDGSYIGGFNLSDHGDFHFGADSAMVLVNTNNGINDPGRLFIIGETVGPSDYWSTLGAFAWTDSFTGTVGKNPATTTYFGLKFKIGTATHYGWVKFTEDATTQSLLKWAYESIPDTAITISESSTPSITAADTQSSIRYQASQLRSAFNTQTVAANFALNYDCNLFDTKGMCISAGGRYTTIDNPGINNSAAVVTLGYKVTPNIRIGAYLDQNINISNPTGIDISNNTPLMGAYAVWNKEQSGLGYQVRLANTYQDKDVTQTRTVFNTSEAGSGKSSLTSQSYLAELSYAFQYQDKTLVRPYFGLRYSHLKQDGYTEATSTAVTDPLTVAALRDKNATALLGVKVQRSLTDKATLTAQLGLEQDLHHKVGNYSATDLNGSDLTAIAFNSNIKRTRPVASIGAFYDVTKTQRASATINYQQLPFQSTGSATAYFNYMIGF